jgi:hypothetical protein
MFEKVLPFKFELRLARKPGLFSCEFRFVMELEFSLERKTLSGGFNLENFRLPVLFSDDSCFLAAFLMAGDCLFISAISSDSCSLNWPSFSFLVGVFVGVLSFDLTI